MCEHDKSKFDHNYTSEVVCPYCGYEFLDSWEIADGYDGSDYECRDCGKLFRLDIMVKRLYSTAKLVKCTDCDTVFPETYLSFPLCMTCYNKTREASNMMKES